MDYTGLGVAAPEDFFYEGPEGTIFAAGELAMLYLPLAAAQDLSGHQGMVNDVVLVLADGADRDAIEAELTEAVSGLGVSATVSTRDDADAVRVLYEDIDNDQRFWNASCCRHSSCSPLSVEPDADRIVEAQRREIGIGMALGVPPAATRRPSHDDRRAGGGAGHRRRTRVGLLVGNTSGTYWNRSCRCPPQPGVYLQAGSGWRSDAPAQPRSVLAVRVRADRAIRTGHLAAKTSRLSSRQLCCRFNEITPMPIRNVLRTTPARVRRRCRRHEDHRSGGRARDARQLRRPTIGQTKGRRRQYRGSSTPEPFPCRHSDLRCCRRRTHRSGLRLHHLSAPEPTTTSICSSFVDLERGFGRRPSRRAPPPSSAKQCGRSCWPKAADDLGRRGWRHRSRAPWMAASRSPTPVRRRHHQGTRSDIGLPGPRRHRPSSGWRMSWKPVQAYPTRRRHPIRRAAGGLRAARRDVQWTGGRSAKQWNSTSSSATCS